MKPTLKLEDCEQGDIITLENSFLKEIEIALRFTFTAFSWLKYNQTISHFLHNYSNRKFMWRGFTYFVSCLFAVFEAHQLRLFIILLQARWFKSDSSSLLITAVIEMLN